MLHTVMIQLEVKIQKSINEYYYENKIQEDDVEQWCFQAGWFRS